MFWAIMILVFLYCFNAVDYFQTIYMTYHLGLAAELNPIMRFWLENNCAWVVKLVLPIILLVEVGRIIKEYKNVIWTIFILTMFYFFLIIHNFCMMEMAGLI